MDPIEQLLRDQPALWRGRQHPRAQRCAAPGSAALAAFLPGGGWPLGTLSELLSPAPGGGELSLLLPALARASARRPVALIAPPHPPCAPALARAGLVLESLWVAATERDTDTAWAAEQALRSGAFAAVVLWLARADDTRLRRLQLAAEAGGDCWAVAQRPAAAASQSSPAALRLLLEEGELRVLKCRGQNPGQRPLATLLPGAPAPPPATPAPHTLALFPPAANG